MYLTPQCISNLYVMVQTNKDLKGEDRQKMLDELAKADKAFENYHNLVQKSP